MADTNKGAALLLNDAGNIDRARTTDGSIFRIESTLSMEAAEEAKTAAANCNTATESAEAAEKTRVSNENARKTAETERGNNDNPQEQRDVAQERRDNTSRQRNCAKECRTTRQNNETSWIERRDRTQRLKASAMTSISPINRHRATRPLRRTARLRVRTQRRTRRCRSPTPWRKAAQEARTSRSCVPRTRSSQRFWRTRQVSSYTWAEQSTARLQRHRRAG